MSDLGLILFGWLLGIIGALIAPEIKEWYDLKKAIGRFKRQLRLELSNTEREIQSQLNSYVNVFKIKNINDNKSVKIALDATTPVPTIVRAEFQTGTFDRNSNLLIFLEDGIQIKINEFYSTIRFLNSIPEGLQRSDDFSKRRLLIKHVHHLRTASQEIEEITRDL